MFAVTSLLTGLVFGLGLIVSGMVNPAKVLGFLDIGGAWDLSLVMAGAIAVGFVAFLFGENRTLSLMGAEMKLPTASLIDQRLVMGSTLFGISWGITGFCPGPGLVALSMGGESKALVFVAAMLAGMAVFEMLELRRPAMPPRLRED